MTDRFSLQPIRAMMILPFILVGTLMLLGASRVHWPPNCPENSGSVAHAVCAGYPGSPIWIEMLRRIPNPPARLDFRRTLQAGVIQRSTSPITLFYPNRWEPNGGFVAVAPTPASLCSGGSNSVWDVYLIDSQGRAWGQIGKFTVDCRRRAATTSSGPVGPKPPQPFTPCHFATYYSAQAMPCQGTPGTRIWVRLNGSRALPQGPYHLSFMGAAALPTNGAFPHGGGLPATVTVALTSSGNGFYSAIVPSQMLCAAAGSQYQWRVRLIADGNQSLGDISNFLMYGCPR